MRRATLSGIMYTTLKSKGMEALWKDPYATRC